MAEPDQGVRRGRGRPPHQRGCPNFSALPLPNMIHSAQPAPSAGATFQNYRPALAVITTVFFMWGFVTVLNDILVPHLKAIFELNYTEIMLLQSIFFLVTFLLLRRD